MNRSFLAGTIAMAMIVLASNILVQFRLGDWLTWGALSYPFAFLVTDLMNRWHGPSAAWRVVMVGFAVGLACSLIGTQVHGTSGPIVSVRVALGSGAAFLSAQLLDITVFNQFRDGPWWRAPLISSILGSILDTALFFTIACFTGLVVDRAQRGCRLGEWRRFRCSDKGRSRRSGSVSPWRIFRSK